MKKVKHFISLIVISILCCVPMSAYATATDLGHGDGCLHSHTSACYHQHSSSCYHAHTSSCYKSHTHTDSCYSIGYHNVKNSSSSTSKGVINCPSCGNSWNGNYKISYCEKCFKDAYPATCPMCGKLCFYAGGVSNYDRDCKQLTCSKTQDIVCGKTTSTVVCGISTTTPKCGQEGKYTNCVIPTVNYTLPDKWTNQDVTIHLSGNTTGSLTFSDNGTQSIEITSSTGHRIREDITIDKIDKEAPERPNYSLQ